VLRFNIALSFQTAEGRMQHSGELQGCPGIKLQDLNLVGFLAISISKEYVSKNEMFQIMRTESIARAPYQYDLYTRLIMSARRSVLTSGSWFSSTSDNKPEHCLVSFFLEKVYRYR